MLGNFIRKRDILTVWPSCLEGVRLILMLPAIAMVLSLTVNPARAMMDLSDEPLLPQIKPAPPNLMILLDDSTSMAFEVLMKDYHEGRFPNPAGDAAAGYGYIYDCPPDQKPTEAAACMGEDDRRLWKSRSHAYNLIYYNPSINYAPWPGFGNRSFPPADPKYPRLRPIGENADSLDLDDRSFSVTLEIAAVPVAVLEVGHAHYFQEGENGEIYLIVLDGERERVNYFEVTQVEGSGMTEKVKTVKAINVPPAEIMVSDYGKARQNFANWFAYHRRREYVAKGTVAALIQKLEGVRIGVLSLSGRVIVPLQPVSVWREGVLRDERSVLLQSIYGCDSAGDSPLREGLQDVGEYFKTNSKRLIHHRGDRAEGDGPPYFSSSDGGACQQSFTLMVTDGYYNYEKRDLAVGNSDGDGDSLYDGGPYADTLSETLADVAMHYYENDLSPDAEDAPAAAGLPDRVLGSQQIHSCVSDTAVHQHMVTFGMDFGGIGGLNSAGDGVGSDCANYSGNAEKVAGESVDVPLWPDAIEAKSEKTIDDLLHAAVNGRGRLLNAGDPQTLMDTFTDRIGTVLNRTGSSSPLLATRLTRSGLNQDDIYLFQAVYQTENWSGDVKAFRLDPDTGAILSDVPAWSAADSLNMASAGRRNILSYDGSSGIPFDEKHLSDSQKKLLGPDFSKIVHYLKGENVEGYRTRATRLGDIVHASPVFDAGIVYVGANDGMLHAFEVASESEKALSGKEIFTYVPGRVYGNLNALVQPHYRHKYFVDLTPTIATGNGILGTAEKATLLVGGLGKGGKGYFALDISTPDFMTPNDVLWEFPRAGDRASENDSGYSFSKPVVAQTNSDAPEESWIVLFGNGYDSANGNAVLFILNPETGDLVRKITADNPGISQQNGLSSPIAVDVNADRKVDFVYAGDLKGNMWKFDLTANNSSGWKVAYSDGIYDQPLFKTSGPHGSVQPITTKPEVMLHPDGQGLMVLFGTGKLLGSSDYTDTRPQSVYGIWDYGDRIYSPENGGYSHDDDREYLGTFTRPGLSNQPPNVTLMEQTSEPYTFISNGEADSLVGTDLRVMSGNQPAWQTQPDTDGSDERKFPDLSAVGSSHAGWYYDLPLDGERVTSDVLLRDGRLTVIGFTPDADRCSDQSSSFLMELNAFTGGRLATAVLDLNDDGVLDGQDDVNIGQEGAGAGIPPAGIKIPGSLQPPAVLSMNDLIAVDYLNASTGIIRMQKIRAEKLGVLYWKEIER